MIEETWELRDPVDDDIILYDGSYSEMYNVMISILQKTGAQCPITKKLSTERDPK